MRKIIAFAFAAAFCHAGFAADNARPNPRGAATATTSKAASLTGRGDKEAEQREILEQNTKSNRSTTSRGVIVPERGLTRAVPINNGGLNAGSGPQVGRSAIQITRAPAASSRSAMVPRGNAGGGVIAGPMRGSAATARSATAARAAVMGGVRAGRGAPAKGAGGPARARAAAIGGVVNAPNNARATALFTNTASMGPEYNQCREAYFACMDQFCGLKSDVYRRCLCSDKFRSFRDREEAFDAAKQMILQFNDQNLYAIGLTADEANAMSTASEGESALKTDKSASAAMLENINALLAGTKKASDVPATTSSSSAAQKVLGGGSSLNLNFNTSSGDIWGGGSTSTDPFATASNGNNRGSTNAVNLDTLEGKALYDAVYSQCMSVSSSCANNQASANMVASAYTILISQDCSAYEKSLDAQRQALESTIREANNAMTAARLEDYRAHNSASVNQCIAAVRTEIQDPYACGPKWERCLDFTGLYISATTGEPIYSPQLFKLKDQINLNNLNDTANKVFLDNLDKLRSRAASALNTCKDDSDAVWAAFKQQALIEIAQAQDDKIESVKDNCVSMMTQCYNKQTGDLNMFAEVKGDEAMSTAVQSASAGIGVRAASSMCSDKVLACAALYGDSDGCVVSDTGQVSDAQNKKCGLAALRAFVETVDDTKVSTMCESELKRYMADLCYYDDGSCDTPDSEGNCTQAQIAAKKARVIAAGSWSADACGSRPFFGTGSVYEALVQRADVACLNPDTKQFDPSGQQTIINLMGGYQKLCEEIGGGRWDTNTDTCKIVPVQ